MRNILARFLMVFFILIVLNSHLYSESAIPIKGKSHIKTNRIDHLILDHMGLINSRAAVLTILIKEEVVYSKGFGWLDLDQKKETNPDSAFRIASNSKPIIAAMINDLIDRKKINFESKVFEIINNRRKDQIDIVDSRMNEITIEHLLKHSGGWDREQSFDPVFYLPEIDPELPILQEMSPIQLVRYMAKRTLQFSPGERTSYSNFGYVLLGRVIESISKMTLKKYLTKKFLKAEKIKGIDVGAYDSNIKLQEPAYPINASHFNITVMDGSGGLIASAPALCNFLNKFWINGNKRKGSGYSFVFFGSNPGTSSITRQHSRGFVYAVIFNNRRDGKFSDNSELAKKLDNEIKRML